jgi:hypothetical protein
MGVRVGGSLGPVFGSVGRRGPRAGVRAGCLSCSSGCLIMLLFFPVTIARIVVHIRKERSR